MIISFVNNKGGVLKTTMATNVAGSLVKLCPEQRKVILDLDGQGNVSASFGQKSRKIK
ncbi:ParA family ATPase/ chromosome partitioning protein (plasmid) [Mycoplasmoides pneumoniae]|uniref:ParA family ATPase/ chromosome partitioning protein n=1 Tax=Mycoplasmoides pneumoniae TaxID=2104 RepID=A0AB38WAP1_MYCPM|nr:ParA family ATPase/ chromosome partitioning protein [Mycoplasmoides pneumoniae]